MREREKSENGLRVETCARVEQRTEDGVLGGHTAGESESSPFAHNLKSPFPAAHPAQRTEEKNRAERRASKEKVSAREGSSPDHPVAAPVSSSRSAVQRSDRRDSQRGFGFCHAVSSAVLFSSQRSSVRYSRRPPRRSRSSRRSRHSQPRNAPPRVVWTQDPETATDTPPRPFCSTHAPNTPQHARDPPSSPSRPQGGMQCCRPLSSR